MYFEDKKIESLYERSDVIIFDLNGLLIDDEPIQLRATNAAIVGRGVVIDEPYWIAHCVGRKPGEFLAELFKNSLSPEELAGMVRGKDAAYETLVMQNIRGLARPGCLELIRHIKNDAAKKLVLATSTTRRGVELILGRQGLNILPDFDFIISGDEVSKSKPDPEIYLKVSRHFAELKNFLAFEDSRAGVLSAKRAQMHCIAVPNKFTLAQDFAEADIVISDLTRNATRLT